MLFRDVVDAVCASRVWDSATLTRLEFWNGVLGAHDLVAITIEDVDAGLVRLAERGRLKGGKMATISAGAPLKPATINRYLTTVQGVFKFAKKARLVPRSFVSPARGIEKHPEPPDPDRYLRVEEVERIIACAKVVDRRWQRLPALIVLALHTGLRKGNLFGLRWQDVDLQARRVVVAQTKNGTPIASALSERATAALEKLTNRDPKAYVFGNRTGAPMHIDKLWQRSCELAGLKSRGFHQLRHGCGSHLAKSGANQGVVMRMLGHKTLTASARYMHLSINDQRDVVDKAFG